MKAGGLRAIPSPRRLLCAPRSAATHRPTAACVRSAAQGKVCVSTWQRRSPGNPRPSPLPPGSPEGEGEGRLAVPRSPSFKNLQREPTRPTPDPGCLSLELSRVGAGALGRPVPASRGWKARPSQALGSPSLRRYRGSPLPSPEAGRGGPVAGVSAWVRQRQRRD